MGLLLAAVLAACSHQVSAPVPVADAQRKPARDFSGSWEVDFAASDSVQRQVSANLRQWQRDQERRARQPARSGPTIEFGGRDFNDVLALADMAEIITAPELLHIIQGERSVRIRRENTFALVCDFNQSPPVVTRTPFGTESCTWNDRELLFRIVLPESLTVEHQLLLADHGNSLAITTRLQSSTVREPIQVRKVYTRYNPDSQGFRCIETLSKGRVCTTGPGVEP